MHAQNKNSRAFNALQLLMSHVCEGQVWSFQSSLSCASPKGLTTVLAKNGIRGERLCSQNFGQLCCLGCCVVAARLLPKGSCKMHIDKRFVAWLLDCAAIGCKVRRWLACTPTAHPRLATCGLLRLECPLQKCRRCTFCRSAPVMLQVHFQ